MTLLIAGLALWVAAHLYKRLMPEHRAALGRKGRIVVAVSIVVALLLMIFGYKMADLHPVYTPIPGIGHLNNLIMLVAIYLYGMGKAKGTMSNKLRHPMLTGTILFAIAHLLVNGDLASLILFGGIGLWALVEILVINRAQGAWQRPAPGTLRGDLINLVVTLVLFGIIAVVHIKSGHNPFVGTYP